MIIYLRVIVLACVYSIISGLECLYCHNAAHFGECLLKTAQCQDRTEQCYLDISILPSLQRVYTAGCRSKQVCDILSSISGKREVDLSRGKKDSIVCAQCCSNSPDSNTGIPCNGVLCNQKLSGVPNTCAACDRTLNYSTCYLTQQCKPNSVCVSKTLVSNGRTIYELGCQEKTQCDLALKNYLQSFGRRDTGDKQICSACCDTRNCNKMANCTSLRKNQFCYDSSVCGP